MSINVTYDSYSQWCRDVEPPGFSSLPDEVRECLDDVMDGGDYSASDNHPDGVIPTIAELTDQEFLVDVEQVLSTEELEELLESGELDDWLNREDPEFDSIVLAHQRGTWYVMD